MREIAPTLLSFVLLAGCAGERERGADVGLCGDHRCDTDETCSTCCGVDTCLPRGSSCAGIVCPPDAGPGVGEGGTRDADARDAATDHDAPSGESIECGATTCAPGQYCLIECTCCGAALPDGGPPPSADYSCHPIPRGCDPENLCDCALSTPCGSGTCTSARTVECPCA